LLYRWKTFFPLFLFLLLFSLLVAVPVRSEVIHAYDWVKVGAYAKYIWPDGLRVKFPNATRLVFDVHVPAFLEWAVVEKHGDTVRLNVTLFINGTGLLFPPGVTAYEAKHVNATYLKTLFFEVNVHTREASLDGKPVGKTSFWAEPYATVREGLVLSSPPSDLVVGNVTYVRTYDTMVGKEITIYGVFANQRDPYVWANYVFSWYTGVAIEPTLLIPWVVPSNLVGNFGGMFLNGTRFNVTRYAGEPVGANLGLDVGEHMTFELDETNIDISAKTVPEPGAAVPGIWKYLPYAFVATFIGLAAAFVIVRRRKKPVRTASTASSSNVRSCLMFLGHRKAFYHRLFSR
jgi:hypothetical protein